MKKTLAAVLAAAMALSTATVAFAKNTDVSGNWGLGEPGNNVDVGDDIDYDGKKTFDEDIDLYLGINDDLTMTDIGKLYDENWISITPTVTQGKSNLNGSPSVTIRKDKDSSDKYVRIRFKVKDTYNSDVTVGLKVRISFKKDIYKDENENVTTEKKGDIIYKKGDSLTTDEITIKVKYNEITPSEDMTITNDDLDDRIVKLKGDKLYDEVGNDTFTIYFEDYAAFKAKASSSQKNVNLFYTTDEISAVTEAYPNVDFLFLDFKGKPSFVNSGSMTFDAIGGKDTTVYNFDGETLTPLASSYDSTYKTVEVKNVKKLGTFVVASEVLEVEDEEDNEPVSSAPIVEESSSSQPSDDSGDRNPSTGAC